MHEICVTFMPTLHRRRRHPARATAQGQARRSRSFLWTSFSEIYFNHWHRLWCWHICCFLSKYTEKERNISKGEEEQVKELKGKLVRGKRQLLGLKNRVAEVSAERDAARGDATVLQRQLDEAQEVLLSSFGQQFS